MKSIFYIGLTAAIAIAVLGLNFQSSLAAEQGVEEIAPGNINKIPGDIDENAPKAIEDANEIGDPHVIPDEIGDPNARAPGLTGR
jgi:hypothetical protein